MPGSAIPLIKQDNSGNITVVKEALQIINNLLNQQKLAIMSDLSKFINSSIGENQEKKLVVSSPDFVWVLRDFFWIVKEELIWKLLKKEMQKKLKKLILE